MKTYKYIFFDLDRTLWDFETNAEVTLKNIFNAHGLKQKCQTDFNTFHQKYKIINLHYWTLYRNNEITKEDLTWKRFAEVIAFFNYADEDLGMVLGREYVQNSPLQKQVFKGTMEVLDYLKQKGYVLWLVTNGFNEVQQKKIVNCGLDIIFDGMLTSEDAGAKKPHPRIFEKAICLANAEKDKSIMIGDDIDVDILGAKAFGIDQVYFNHENRFITCDEATYSIATLEELKNIL